MGSNQSQNFNKDVEIKGDINVYICGDINYKSNQKNHITNYDIIKKYLIKKCRKTMVILELKILLKIFIHMNLEN